MSLPRLGTPSRVIRRVQNPQLNATNNSTDLNSNGDQFLKSKQAKAVWCDEDFVIGSGGEKRTIVVRTKKMVYDLPEKKKEGEELGYVYTHNADLGFNVGTCFQSYEALERAVAYYQARTGTRLVKSSSNSIRKQKKYQISEETASRVVFDRVCYLCHYHRPTKRGTMSNLPSNGIDCGFEMVINFDFTNNLLRVSSTQLHHSHLPSRISSRAKVAKAINENRCNLLESLESEVLEDPSYTFGPRRRTRAPQRRPNGLPITPMSYKPFTPKAFSSDSEFLFWIYFEEVMDEINKALIRSQRLADGKQGRTGPSPKSKRSVMGQIQNQGWKGLPQYLLDPSKVSLHDQGQPSLIHRLPDIQHLQPTEFKDLMDFPYHLYPGHPVNQSKHPNDTLQPGHPLIYSGYTNDQDQKFVNPPMITQLDYGSNGCHTTQEDHYTEYLVPKIEEDEEDVRNSRKSDFGDSFLKVLAEIKQSGEEVLAEGKCKKSQPQGKGRRPIKRTRKDREDHKAHQVHFTPPTQAPQFYGLGTGPVLPVYQQNQSDDFFRFGQNPDLIHGDPFLCAPAEFNPCQVIEPTQVENSLSASIGKSMNFMLNPAAIHDVQAHLGEEVKYNIKDDLENISPSFFSL